MRIPRKIAPDNLKDSIIQVIYNTEFPEELLLGNAEIALKGVFSFVAGTPKKEFQFNEKGSIVLQESERGFFISTDQKFKLNISSSAIIFNQQERYSGWEAYFNCISETLKRLFQSRVITDVIRIGVRYISHFPEINVFECTHVSIDIGAIPANPSEATQLRTEVEEDNFKIIVTLVNRSFNENGNKASNAILDFDVIQRFEPNLNELDQVLDRLVKAHEKQKIYFFTLLKEDFLKSLNPEY